MRLFSIFITAVFATSIFSNLQSQAQHLGTGIKQHATKFREHASKARHLAADRARRTFSEAKKAYSWLKEKILSKFKGKQPPASKPEEKMQDPEFEMNSSALNEFIRRFTAELEKQQKLNQHAGAGEAGEEELENNGEESEEALEEHEVDEGKLAL